jgi:hypothetical protein
MPDEPASLKLYRWFLKLYPATFRENYAELLEGEFRDELRESTGTAALCALWIRLIADIAISVPLQLAHEVAQDAKHTVRLWSRRPWHIAFAILALTIACVGLYGTMSYTVTRRSGEIGIRMALGAQRRGVVWMVLREVLLMVAVALAISVPAALATSKFIESFLFGMKGNDAMALIAAAVILAGAATLAGYLPARHASRIDPLVVLRHDRLRLAPARLDRVAHALAREDRLIHGVVHEARCDFAHSARGAAV